MDFCSAVYFVTTRCSVDEEPVKTEELHLDQPRRDFKSNTLLAIEVIIMCREPPSKELG